MFDSTTLDSPAREASPKPTSLRAAAPALIALSLAMLVEMVDNSVLNVALPTIGRDLHSGTGGLQWIISAYSLTFGALLLVGGSLGDRLGRRRVLAVGPARLRRGGRARAVRALDRRADRRAGGERRVRGADRAGDDVADVSAVR